MKAKARGKGEEAPSFEAPRIKSAARLREIASPRDRDPRPHSAGARHRIGNQRESSGNTSNYQLC